MCWVQCPQYNTVLKGLCHNLVDRMAIKCTLHSEQWTNEAHCSDMGTLFCDPYSYSGSEVWFGLAREKLSCTDLWFCVCKKLNSSLIRSHDSGMVNLNGWPGCGGPCQQSRHSHTATTVDQLYERPTTYMWPSSNKQYNNNLSLQRVLSPYKAPFQYSTYCTAILYSNWSKSVAMIKAIWESRTYRRPIRKHGAATDSSLGGSVSVCNGSEKCRFTQTSAHKLVDNKNIQQS